MYELHRYRGRCFLVCGRATNMAASWDWQSRIYASEPTILDYYTNTRRQGFDGAAIIASRIRIARLRLSVLIRRDKPQRGNEGMARSKPQLNPHLYQPSLPTSFAGCLTMEFSDCGPPANHTLVREINKKIIMQSLPCTIPFNSGRVIGVTFENQFAPSVPKLE